MYAERTMQAPLSTIFTKPQNDAPWWALPILTFVFGVAMTASALYPIAATPDYKRGHDAGFREGRESATASIDTSIKDAYEAGRRVGLAERSAH